MAHLKFPPGAGLLDYMCGAVWQKLLCTLLHQREHMMNLLLFFSLLWAYPTRPEPSARTVKRIQSSLKQKPPILSLTWKTVLIFPQTVEQKIRWYERKPQNHTTIPEPISISLPLEKQFLRVLVAAGLCSDKKTLPGRPRRHWVLCFKPIQNRLNDLVRIKWACVQLKDFKQV